VCGLGTTLDMVVSMDVSRVGFILAVGVSQAERALTEKIPGWLEPFLLQESYRIRSATDVLLADNQIVA